MTSQVTFQVLGSSCLELCVQGDSEAALSIRVRSAGMHLPYLPWLRVKVRRLTSDVRLLCGSGCCLQGEALFKNVVAFAGMTTPT